MAKTDDWYVSSGRYAEDLEREIRGREDRLTELGGLGLGDDDPVYAEAAAARDAATAALKKLRPAKKAAKK